MSTTRFFKTCMHMPRSLSRTIITKHSLAPSCSLATISSTTSDPTQVIRRLYENILQGHNGTQWREGVKSGGPQVLTCSPLSPPLPTLNASCPMKEVYYIWPPLPLCNCVLNTIGHFSNNNSGSIPYTGHLEGAAICSLQKASYLLNVYLLL